MDRLLDFYRNRYGDAVKRQGDGFNGPCPFCGGQPGRSDRFMVWPGRTEGLGKVARENGLAGIWWCRKCGASGDTINWLMQVEGLDFREALAELGIEGAKWQAPRFRKAPCERLHEDRGFQPQTPGDAGSKWREAAEKLLQSAESQIFMAFEARAWLMSRGLDDDAVARYRLGYLPGESRKFRGNFRSRASFGLEPKQASDGRVQEKLFIPRGIVIPSLDSAGHVCNLRIRRPSQDLVSSSGRQFPKYHEVEGSRRAPMLLPASLRPEAAVYFVVEAELDAILIHWLSQGRTGAIAVRTNRGKPDLSAHRLLSECARICVALDYDEAGAAGVDFWEQTYPQAIRWPVPVGKDPGEAFRLDCDLEAWIEAALPCSQIPVAEIGQAIPQAGALDIRPANAVKAVQMDACASGQKNLGERGKPDFVKPGMMFDIEDRSFNNSQRAQILRACPDRLLHECVPFEAVCAWLQWHRTPEVRFNRTTGRFEPHDFGLSGFLANSEGFSGWLAAHPDEIIGIENFFRR